MSASDDSEIPAEGGPYHWRLRVWTRFLVPSAQVWARKTDPAAIRDELRPLRFSLDGTVLERLAGEARAGVASEDVLPADVDARLFPPGIAWPVRITEWTALDADGHAAFTDTSSNALMEAWHHRHVVQPTSDGCRYLDDVCFRAASALPDDLVARSTAALFGHRHRRAARHLAADARATGVTVLRQLLPHERGED